MKRIARCRGTRRGFFGKIHDRAGSCRWSDWHPVKQIGPRIPRQAKGCEGTKDGSLGCSWSARAIGFNVVKAVWLASTLRYYVAWLRDVVKSQISSAMSCAMCGWLKGVAMTAAVRLAAGRPHCVLWRCVTSHLAGLTTGLSRAIFL